MSAEDSRVHWILDYIHQVFPDIPEQLITLYKRDNKQTLQKYLDDKVVFKSLFFQDIYNEEDDMYRKRAQKAKEAREARRERRRRREARRAGREAAGAKGSKSASRASSASKAGSEDKSDEEKDGEEKEEDKEEEDDFSDDDDDADDDEESGSSEDEDIYTGPPPPILKMYVDKITEKIHPFDIKFVYFTRLDRGPIPEPPNGKEKVNDYLKRYMIKGLMDKDPIQMLHAFLKSNRVVMKAVKAVGTPEAGFEDKYIKKFYKLVESNAGKVPLDNCVMHVKRS